jgi:WD40 repeat protein
MSLAYSPHGDSITCGYQDGGVVSWDVATGTPRATYAEHAASYTDPILCVAYSPNGALLAGTNLGYYAARMKRAAYVWRTTDHALAYKLGGFRYWVYAVAFSADGVLLAVGGDDRWVKLYDVQSGEERGPTLPQLPYSVSSLAFSPQGRLLVAGCDGSQMKFWDLDAGAEERTVQGHFEWTWALAFHPSGSLVASGGEDGVIILWDSRTAQRVQILRRPDPTRGRWSGNSVNSLSFNPQGTLLASASFWPVRAQARALSCGTWPPPNGRQWCKMKVRAQWHSVRMGRYWPAAETRGSSFGR